MKENEIRTLNQQIADLKALRDRSEVAKVVAKYSDEEERFDALIKISILPGPLGQPG